uniref:Aromatic aminotransferase 3 n=1 Tax=Mastigamoeba balamuthi TaxID=108607 RepID=A0A1S5RCW1_MASBA|nr:aromatic aminotransferase 3 [Mastigamoeba balamuthi]|eukprot:m51a1_g9967 putative aminotransferase (437) ;mRNA; r:90059-91516
MEDVHPLCRRSISDPTLIDLEAGAPGLHLLPATALAAATTRVLIPNYENRNVDDGDSSAATAAAFDPFTSPLCMLYGALRGPLSLRRALSDYLNGELAACSGYERCSAEELCVTNGCSQSLDLLCARLCRPGDVVLAERITYFLCQSIFEDHGVRVVPVEVGADGIDVADLEAKMKAHRPRMLYMIPVYQNPTGATVPHAARQAIVALARRHSCAVVSDEVCELLWFDPGRLPPAPMACYDDRAPDWPGVVSVWSLSKLVCPGLRLGFLHSRRPALLDACSSAGYVVSGGGLNPVLAAAVREMLLSGDLAQHVRALRGSLAGAASELSAALAQQFGADVEVRAPGGGFFLWAALRGRAGEALGSARDKVLAALAAEGVAVKRGDLCLLREEAATAKGAEVAAETAKAMRLCLAYCPRSRMSEGVARIRKALGTLGY